jgi:hypothetical protein
MVAPMPTLIRFLIFLLILAGLVFGAMVALAVFVNPTPKEVRVRIPATELGGQESTSVDPLGIRPPILQPEPEDTESPPPEEPVPGEPAADGTQTVELPPE